MSYRHLRFIGGPKHNTVDAVRDDVSYIAVPKYLKLSKRLDFSGVITANQLVCKQIIYTRQRVNGIEFMLADHIRLNEYLGGLFGAQPTEKAEKRKRQKQRKKLKDEYKRAKIYGYNGNAWHRDNVAQDTNGSQTLSSANTSAKLVD